MSGYDFVADRAAGLLARAEAAAARAGRKPSEVAVMAVTKFHPAEAVEAAYRAGLRLFGESRVQEAEGKFPGFLAEHPDARLEMIGTLQSNKAKRAAALFSRIQSVDSEELLKELDKRARALGLRLEILLELHTGEESKAGFPGLDSLFRALELYEAFQVGFGAASAAGAAGAAGVTGVASASGAAGGSAGLVLRGLMTMAPYTKDEAPIRASFRALREAREAALARFSLPGFDVLSMGMTNDFEAAIEEGSTLVRVGTALFGSREG